MDMQGVLTSLMASGVNYKDLEEMGLTISDDYLDGGTITFDEAKFKAAMTSDPEKVSNIFTGGGDVKKGLASIIEDTLTPYATKYANRNGNSYGRLIEEAGSEKIPLSVMNNQIYKQLKDVYKRQVFRDGGKGNQGWNWGYEIYQGGGQDHHVRPGLLHRYIILRSVFAAGRPAPYHVAGPKRALRPQYL